MKPRTSGPAHILAIFLLLVPFTIAGGACGGPPASENSDSSITIVTTVHPLAAVVRGIVGEIGRVETLIPAGASPHGYSPRPSDARTAARSTVLVYGDEHLDGWAARLQAPEAIGLFSLLPDSLKKSFPAGVLPRQHVPEGKDPHFWTDPLTVRAIVPPLTDRLCSLLPDRCDRFGENAAAFVEDLDSLHAMIGRRLKPFGGVSVLLATPFLQYFVDRYNLNLVGVLDPSPGGEIPPRTLADAINAAQTRSARVILAPRQASADAAETISRSTGIPLVILDPIGPPGRGDTFEDLLMSNVRIIVRALR